MQRNAKHKRKDPRPSPLLIRDFIWFASLLLSLSPLQSIPLFSIEFLRKGFRCQSISSSLVLSSSLAIEFSSPLCLQHFPDIRGVSSVGEIRIPNFHEFGDQSNPQSPSSTLPSYPTSAISELGVCGAIVEWRKT